MEIEIGAHPDRVPTEEAVGFASDRARAVPARAGAFVTETRVGADRHDWTVVVSDGRRWAYVHAWGTGFGPWTRISPTLVARAVEGAVPRSVPERHRIEVFRRRGPVRITPSVLAAVRRTDGRVE
jgi:hypothetical protein